MFGGYYFAQPMFAGGPVWLFTRTPTTAVITWNAEPTTLTTWEDQN